MSWINLDDRLKELYNTMAEAHSETVSKLTAVRAEERVFELMEEINNALKGNELSAGISIDWLEMAVNKYKKHSYAVNSNMSIGNFIKANLPEKIDKIIKIE